MKKALYYFAIVSALLMLSGCIQEQNTEDNPFEVTFNVSLEDATKTSYETGGKVNWVEGDIIRYYTLKDGPVNEYEVVRSGHSIQMVANVPDDAQVIIAQYGGTGLSNKSVKGFTLDGVVKAEQSGKFEDAHVSVAKSFDLTNGASLTFRNITSIMKFSFTRGDVAYIVFTANGGEKIHGDGRLNISFSDTEPSASFYDAGGSSIRVNVGGAGTFFLSTLPVKLSRGFVIEYFDTANLSLGKTMVESPVTSTRNQVLNLGTLDERIVEPAPEPEAIDLGLPSGVKWASFNIGATKPEEYGDYYAWGELNPKSVYDVSTYNYFSNGEYKCTKYCPKYLAYYWNGQGEPDNKTVLDPEDDVAHVLLGDKWHIPTLEEKNELINNCSLTWTSNYNGTGVAGMVVTSKMTGFTDKSIFLPASGSRPGTNINGVGTICNYWSSSLDINIPSSAYGLSYYSPSNIFWDGATRSVGWSVRPVYGEPTISFTLTLNVNYLELIVGNSAYLSAVITPSNYCSESSVRWASRDDTIASVDQSGSIVALKEGSTVIDAYSSNGLSASCTIVVRAEKFPEPEAVDFGLSVKWASFNLGASKPEEYGDYFAWGETEPYYIEGYAHTNPCYFWKDGKDKGYTWASYKYAKGNEKQLTKYCTQFNYWGGSGSPDGLTLFSQTSPPYMDDAARTILGSEWRIPTRTEWDDLRRYCDWEWTDDFNGTGTQGYIVSRSSYTDKFIFLPAAGARSYLDCYGDNSGEYWSSNIVRLTPSDAYYFRISSNDKSEALTYRSSGLSIRPVYFDSINPSSATLNKTVSTLTAGDTQ